MPKLAGETRSAMYPLPYRQNCLFAARHADLWFTFLQPTEQSALKASRFWSLGLPKKIVSLGNAFKCCSFKPAGKVRNHGKGRHWTNTEEDLSVDPWILHSSWQAECPPTSGTARLWALAPATKSVYSSYEVSTSGAVMMQNKSSDKVIVIDQNIAWD